MRGSGPSVARHCRKEDRSWAGDIVRRLPCRAKENRRAHSIMATFLKRGSGKATPPILEGPPRGWQGTGTQTLKRCSWKTIRERSLPSGKASEKGLWDGRSRTCALSESIFSASCFRVYGSGFRGESFGLRVEGSGFLVQCSGFRDEGSGFRGRVLGFKV